LRVEAERTGDRLKTGSLEGPVEAQIRGRSGSLTVWLWRGEDQSIENGVHPHAAE
jgi:adenylate cyclase